MNGGGIWRGVFRRETDVLLSKWAKEEDMDVATS